MTHHVQFSFHQALFLITVPLAIHASAHFKVEDDSKFNRKIVKHTVKTHTAFLDFDNRFENRDIIITAPQKVPEPIADIIIFEKQLLKDTLETEEIGTLEKIIECKCAPNPVPLILIEADIPPTEQDTHSTIPEPVYSDPNVLEAIIYPNPAIESTTLELDITVGEQFEIQLYDLSGQKVRVIHTGWLSSGRQKFGIDLYGLVTGMYILLVSSAHQQENLKVQKI